MHIELAFTASGARANVVNQIGQQIRQARNAHPEAGHVLYAIRDHAVNSVANAHETAEVSVNVNAVVEIQTTIGAPAEAPAPEAPAAEPAAE